MAITSAPLRQELDTSLGTRHPIRPALQTAFGTGASVFSLETVSNTGVGPPSNFTTVLPLIFLRQQRRFGSSHRLGQRAVPLSQDKYRSHRRDVIMIRGGSGKVTEEQRAPGGGEKGRPKAGRRRVMSARRRIVIDGRHNITIGQRNFHGGGNGNQIVERRGRSDQQRTLDSSTNGIPRRGIVFRALRTNTWAYEARGNPHLTIARNSSANYRPTVSNF